MASRESVASSKSLVASFSKISCIDLAVGVALTAPVKLRAFTASEIASRESVVLSKVFAPSAFDKISCRDFSVGVSGTAAVTSVGEAIVSTASRIASNESVVLLNVEAEAVPPLPIKYANILSSVIPVGVVPVPRVSTIKDSESSSRT